MPFKNHAKHWRWGIVVSLFFLNYTLAEMPAIPLMRNDTGSSNENIPNHLDVAEAPVMEYSDDVPLEELTVDISTLSLQDNPDSPAVLSHIWLGASYRQGSSRIFPLHVLVKQRDAASTIQGVLVFDTRRMQSIQQSFSCKDSTQVTFQFNETSLRIITKNRAGLACFLGGRLCDSKRININSMMVLRSLFAADDLPVDAQVLKKLYEDLQENEAWYQILTGKKLSLAEKTADDGLEMALAEKWPDLLEIMQQSLGQLAELCKPLKQDTLHLIGRPPITRGDLLAGVVRATDPLQWYDQAPQTRFIQDNAGVLSDLSKTAQQWLQFFRSAAEEGRIDFVGGMWSDPDLRLISGESTVRQILYGKTFFRDTFSAEPRIAYTGGCIPQLPQILLKSGFDFLTIPLRPDSLFFALPSHLLQWSSPDGSTIPAGITADFQQLFDLKELSLLITRTKQKLGDRAVLCNLSDASATNLWPQIEKAASLAAYPAIRFNRLPDLLQTHRKKFIKLLQSHGHTMPLSQAPQPPHPFLQGILRQCEAELLTADVWQSFVNQPSAKSKLDSAWRLLLRNQSEAVLSATAERKTLARVSLELNQVLSLADALQREARADLLEKISTKNKGQPLVVFNPLAWQRSGLAMLSWKDDAAVKEIKDSYGQSTPFQQQNDTLIFKAENVPSVGYKTYWIHTGTNHTAASELQVTDRVLENSFVRLEINPGNGNIQRFYDKKRNRELLHYGQMGNRLQLLPKTEGGAAAGSTTLACDQVESISILENGPARGVVRYIRKGGDLRITQDYILHENMPRLDVRIEVQEIPNAVVQTIWPFQVKSDTVYYGTAFGVTARAQSAGSNEESVVQGAFDVLHLKDKDNPVLMLHSGYVPFSLQGHNLVLDLMHPVPADGASKGEQRHQGEQAPITCRYAILTHEGDMQPCDILRAAREYHQPLKVERANPRSAKLPAEFSFLTAEANSSLVSAIKKSYDDETMIIRFFEANGHRDQINLRFGEQMKEGWRVNLLEETIQPLPVADRDVEIPLKPFEIYTLKIDMTEF
ncbi:hypothetical protein JXO59_10855 [candidate division KSB1 bacterium]|nr:hypothetical protein [candidate division KSB1 bacterium]